MVEAGQDVAEAEDVALLAQLIGSPATLERAVVPFRGLLGSRVLIAAVERELEVLRAGGSVNRQAPVGQLQVLATPELRVRGRIVQPDAPTSRIVSGLTRHTLVGNAGTATFVVRRFRQPHPEPNDVFDPTKKLETLGDTALEPGEAIALRAAVDAYDIVAQDAAAIALIAASPYMVDLEWHYERATLRPKRLEPVRNSWLRLRELLRFGEALGAPDLIGALEALIPHPSHFIRWSAARLAMGLSPERGTEVMRALVDDPHPQLQAAARKTLRVDAA